MNYSLISIKSILLTMLIFTISFGESVCKLSYSGQPESLNGQSLTVPAGSVAFSENVHVGIPAELLAGTDVSVNPSIMFVLDNSSSMWLDSAKFRMDVDANRFKVTKRIIDEIYQKNPNAEVGLSVFMGELYFDKNDDTLFDLVNSKDSYGYLPLLTLNKMYTSSNTAIGKKSGRDILTEYLKTKTITDKDAPNDKYVGLNYSSGADGGTNITAGFDAAVSAFKSSANSKKHQYVIFISDGDANRPTPVNKDSTQLYRFREGVNVPTTFTIFFSKDNTVPASIKTMTTKIQGNGYSENNGESKAWPYTNTGENELMTFVMDNIISVISRSTNAQVKNITINGGSQSNWDKATNSVLFSEMFPLTGMKTPFQYDIHYLVEDTTVADGVQQIRKVDTTYITKFSAEIKSGAALPAGFTSQCWERSLGFYDGAVKAASLSASKLTSELRFEEKAGDLLYGYPGVQVTVRSLKKGDTETFDLSKNGLVFTKNITFDPKNPAGADGIIQVDLADTVIALFRNPKLPMDTIELKIPFDAGTVLSLKKSSFFDSNADGFTDSIIADFGTDKVLTAEQAAELASLLTIAPDRKIAVIGSEWKAGKLILKVQENSGVPNTAVSASDTVTLRETVMTSGGLTYSSKTSALDSMAPVIVDGGAVLNNLEGTADDRLTVQFSEPVTPAPAGVHFDFRRGSQNYTAELTPETTSGSLISFKLGTLSIPFMQAGDTLRISAVRGLVKDTSGFVQKNPKNIERQLRVTTTVSVTKSAFFDKSGDGLTDLVTIDFSTGEGLVLNADELNALVSLPISRKMSIDSVKAAGGKLSLYVKELNPIPSTAVTGADSIRIRAGIISGGVTIAASALLPADSMAPVILEGGAVLNDVEGTAEDRLNIRFSEPVKLIGSAGNHFDFRRKAQAYSAVTTAEKLSGDEISFMIGSISLPFMSAGDSLRISAAKPLVSDTLGTVQKNPANIERRLEVTTTLQMKKASFFDNSGDGFVDSIAVDLTAGEGSAITAADLLPLITLPAARSFSIDSAKITGSKLAIMVKENRSVPNTAVTASDSITIKSGTVGTALVPANAAVLPADSMAPVIVKDGVVLYDYPGVSDTLQTQLSETVPAAKISGKYFTFRSGAAPYDVFVTPIRVEGSAVLWSVDNSSKPIKENDSLRISASARLLKDSAGTAQDNPLNREERVQVITSIDIGGAHYFDASGDGFIDSLEIETAAGEGAVLSAEKLVPLITLPAARGFTVTGSEIKPGRLVLKLKESGLVPNTAVSAADSITVNKGSAGTAVVAKTKTLLPADHIAPVILPGGALYVDYDRTREDSVTVQFSETVQPFTLTGEPFAVRRGAVTYKLFLTPVSFKGNTALFTVQKTAGGTAPAVGDSIRIGASAMISDTLANVQKNLLNVERPLTVKIDIKADSAAWFDRSGDGMIDEIRIPVIAGDALISRPAAETAALFTLPAGRSFTVEASVFKGDTLVMNVTEGSLVPNTAVLAGDRITAAVTNPLYQITSPAVLIPADSAAPVIMPGGAVILDSLAGTDYMKITFSEPVKYAAGSFKPLAFTDGTRNYIFTLTALSKESTTTLFRVDSADGLESLSDIDSVWINPAAGVTLTDLNGLSQTNEKNIRRPADVSVFVNPFELVVNAVTPWYLAETAVPEAMNLQEFELGQTEKGEPSGMIIQAQAVRLGVNEPLRGITLEGELMIHDALGNLVMETVKMVPMQNYESLIFVWNGKNERGRFVGSGTYAARVQVRASAKNSDFRKAYITEIMLAVKVKGPVEP